MARNLIATLPMYDLPELRAATDRWWSALALTLREQGVDAVPARLERGVSREMAWASPALLLAQTCGYPLTHAHAGDLRVVAIPCYHTPGCDGWRYSSLVVVRRDDPARGLDDLSAQRSFAANGPDSHSGWNALQHLVSSLAGAPIEPSDVTWTGAHARSIAAVVVGKADVCAVDCVTHGLLARHSPAALEGTRVLGRTVSAPALPYVTHATVDEERVAILRRALETVSRRPALASVRDALLLEGFADAPPGCYEEILDIERVWRG